MITGVFILTSFTMDAGMTSSSYEDIQVHLKEETSFYLDDAADIDADAPAVPSSFNAFCLAGDTGSDATAVIETVIPEVEVLSRKLHLKTNAVGLGVAVANAAAEIDLARHWSFTFPVYYSAWDYFESTVKFRTFAIQPEFRYWLSEENEGFFGGAHFGLSKYNFAFDGDYRYQDHNRETPSIGGGVSMGYRLPIIKNNRWRVEFSLGAGAYTTHHDKFYNTPNTKGGLMIETIKKTYWGIDHAAVSFSYSFDLKKKGGT